MTDLATLRALLAAATMDERAPYYARENGLWGVYDVDGITVAYGLPGLEAEAITALLNAAPALLDEIERLRRLEPFVDHSIGCPDYDIMTIATDVPPPECTCGYDAARGGKP